MNQVIQTTSQQYYLSKLLSYSYIIVHKPGKPNLVADALSRRDPLPNSQYFLLINPSFDFLTSLVIENKTRADLQALHGKFHRCKTHTRSSKL